MFVTGGTGFLGSAVVADLLSSGHEVRCLARNEASAERLLNALGAPSRRLDIVFGSLRPEGVDPGWLTGTERVVHVAGAMRGAPSTLVRQNVAATRALVDAAAAAGVTRFVLVSSLGVYAPHALRPGAVLDEACPIEPLPARRGPYVYSKVAQERACRVACGNAGMPLVIVRPGVIFGPGRSCITDRVGLRLGRAVAIVDPGRRLPYVFVENCAAAVALAASRDCADGECFNVVDDELPTPRHLVRACHDAGWDLRTMTVPGWATMPLSRMYGWCQRRSDTLLPISFVPYVAEATYKRLQYSNSLAKARLGWRPAVDLRSALQRTLARDHAAALHQ